MSSNEIIRQYKSNSFSLLMKEKKYALQTYNALNNTDYSDPELVEIINIDGGMLLSVRNDASFIIENDLNVYEHQSTVNQNMPLRFLIYVAMAYREYVKEEGRKRLNAFALI